MRWCLTFGTGIIHSPLDARWASRMGFPLYSIFIFSFFISAIQFALKIAVQLASHACLIENKGTWTLGIRWHTFDFTVGKSKGRCPFDTPCSWFELAVVNFMPSGVTISSVSGVC